MENEPLVSACSHGSSAQAGLSATPYSILFIQRISWKNWPPASTSVNKFRPTSRMKKLAMLAAVLLGTTAASQAGLDIHIGIPLPPLPRIVVRHPAPVVVVPAPRYCPPPVVVAPPPCPPVYHYVQRYPHGHPHGYYRHGNHWNHGNRRDGHHHGRDYSHGHHGRR